MAEIKVYRLFLKPQTHIRTTAAERWMFAPTILDSYLKNFGLKKYNERVLKGSKNPGTPNNYYNRKQTIKRYWDYKRKLKELADEQKFIMPIEGAFVKFFIPMPPSWSKKKKAEKCFTLCTSAADIDNYIKGFFDSLMVQDKMIADYRAAKFYYEGTGFIEITIGELPPAIGYSKIIREDKIK